MQIQTGFKPWSCICLYAKVQPSVKAMGRESSCNGTRFSPNKQRKSRTKLWTSQTGTTTFSKSSEAPNPAKASGLKRCKKICNELNEQMAQMSPFSEEKKLEDASERGWFTLRLKDVVATSEPLAGSCSSLYYYVDKVLKTMTRAIENEQKLGWQENRANTVPPTFFGDQKGPENLKPQRLRALRVEPFAGR